MIFNKNKFIKFILILCFLFSQKNCEISATTHTNKTFLLPRPQGSNLALELSIYHDHIFDIKNKQKTHVQATGFYQAQDKGINVGKYFGINGKNSFTIGDSVSYDIENLHIFYNQLTDKNLSPSGKVVFDAEQQMAGVRLDLFQDIAKKFFVKISSPFVYVSNNLRMKVLQETTDSRGANLTEFFAGHFIKTSMPTTSQAELKKAKIKGQKSKIGFANLDFSLGYKFFKNQRSHFFVDVLIGCPTGNVSRGEYLFEPIYGNGGHFTLGWGFDASCTLWQREKHEGKLIFAFNQKYSVESSEYRTVPVKENAGSLKLNLKHYYLAAKNGQLPNLPIFPAANILTQKMSVRPGNELDGLAIFNFKSGRFLIDLGYEGYFKEKESIKLKDWQDNTYGILNEAQAIPATGFDINAALISLNKENFDINGAATPSQFTNKVFASFGYNFSILKNLASLGLGASYEFATSNHEIENYAFWAKLICSF
ncbi:hypothetical protein K9L05_04315 [Candidatus Babeliales bacterium]|nr:hypothetical protein [Candidatus Babeliales bacterium]MCF7899837.1 hypothetical protein [Candidatus Babeliales bacterium]